MPPEADTVGGALHVADCMVLDGSYWDAADFLLMMGVSRRSHSTIVGRMPMDECHSRFLRWDKSAKKDNEINVKKN